MSKIIVFFLIFLLSSQAVILQDKKPVIILFDNGTWEKATAKEVPKQKISIEDFWKDFQKVVIIGEKNDILKYIKFPLSLDLLLKERSPEDNDLKCRRSICELGEAISYQKLDANFKTLFDKNFILGIIQSKSDEFTEGKSEKYSKLNYYYRLKTQTKIFDSVDKTYHSANLFYDVYIVDFDNEFKIYDISIFLEE